MPLPLKPGFHFNFDRKKRPSHYEMTAAEAYTDFYGISYMISGERLIYSPEFTTICYAGDLVFIPKNVYRRTTYISNTPYERILLKFTDEMIADLLTVIGTDAFETLCHEHVLHFSESTQQKLQSILAEMEEEWNHYNKYSELLLKGLLNKLIITCLNERLLDASHDITYEKQQNYLANAIQYIKANLRSAPSLDETAAHVHISASYLSKLFIRKLNTPYSQFVLNEKISNARNLLLYSGLSLTEIAPESGFTSSSYFSDCFKRVTGQTPLQYRREQG